MEYNVNLQSVRYFVEISTPRVDVRGNLYYQYSGKTSRSLASLLISDSRINFEGEGRISIVGSTKTCSWVAVIKNETEIVTFVVFPLEGFFNRIGAKFVFESMVVGNHFQHENDIYKAGQEIAASSEGYNERYAQKAYLMYQIEQAVKWG